MIAQKKPERWWDDEDFQDRLTALLVKDPLVLRSCSGLLSPEDFKPLRGMAHGRERWIVAERALEHFQKHGEPIDRLVRADVLEYSEGINLGAAQVDALNGYLDFLDKIKTSSPDAVSDKVVRFKGQRLKAAAVQELVDLQSSGQLTDERWREVSEKALSAVSAARGTVDYLGTMEDRISRRRLEQNARKAPWTFIDPLDSMVRCVGPRQLGMILAPYKRGKSLGLLWLAVAYALQHINVLYFTLEDPRAVVEDRLDAIVTHVPIKSLHEYPQTLKKRFERFRRMLRTNIEIFDGTEGGVSVAEVERVWLSRREKGFIPQAVIIDYDEEIEPSRSFKEKRFETDDVYRGLRRLMAKYDQIGWVAAQTKRDTRSLKILSGDAVAEDIGKLRKVTMALSIGKGEWTDSSLYLWVAAHKNDKMDVGCEIVPDLDRMLIYDREATSREAKAHGDYAP